MDLKKITPLLRTSDPLTIFRKIVVFNEGTGTDSNKAAVRMGLSSGFVLEGVPLKMDSDGNAIFASVNNSISYVNIKALSCVEVLNPQSLLEVLTDGSYFEIPSGEVPTSLELKRTLQSKGDELKSLHGFILQSDLPKNELPTEAEKHQFGQFLSVLQETLGHIASDSFGKEALQQLQKMTLISSDEQIAVQKKNDELRIGIDFKNKLSSDFKNRFKKILESNL